MLNGWDTSGGGWDIIDVGGIIEAGGGRLMSNDGGGREKSCMLTFG